MNEKLTIKISKFLSLVLRHQPEIIGLKLDEHGWAYTTELLEKANLHNDLKITLEQLKEIVASSDKQRFAFTPDFTMIRANQGHSINVDLELRPIVPPDVLYHGTAERNLESIKRDGLIKGQRHHFHLSSDTETAKAVGERYGKPVILVIDSREMHKSGIPFYKSENGVWLTDSIPPQYINFPMSHD